MKRIVTCVGALVLILGVSALARAGVKDQFKCEEANQKELTKALSAEGKCVADCISARELKGESGRSCSPPFDEITQACADKARGGYLFKLAAKCKTTKLDKIKMPRCGSYAPDYPSIFAFGNGQIEAQAKDQVDDVVESFFVCDVSTADTVKCELGVVKALGKVSQGLSKCLAKCYKRKQTKGELSIHCDPTSLGTLDATTSGCITDVRFKAAALIVAKCSACNQETDVCLPNCGAYIGFGKRPDLSADFVTKLQYPTYKEENPDADAPVGVVDGGANPFCAPRVCGDGTVTAPVNSGVQDEECDPGDGGTCQAPSLNTGADCVNNNDCNGGDCGGYTVAPDDSTCTGLCGADCLCP